MDVEDKKMLQYLLRYAALTAVAVCAIIYLCCQPAANDNSTVGYVEQIESTSDRAASTIGDGTGRVDAAEKALSRVDTAISRGQDAVTESTGRIDRIQNIIDGCVTRNQQATALVKRIKDTNRQGTE